MLCASSRASQLGKVLPLVMRIDPQRLIRLGELIREGSFRRAADKLGITQPALSQSIAQMEAEVGVRLIERTSHGVVPTIYGQALLEHAKAIEWQLSEAVLKVSELTVGHRNKLAVGGMSGGAISVLVLAICKLREEMPEFDARLIEESWNSSLLAQIDDRSLDLAICHYADDISLEGKVAVPLFQANRVLCVRTGHPVADRLSLAALAPYPFASPEGAIGVHLDIQRIFNAFDIEFPKRQIFNSNSIAAAKQAVLYSDAYAIFSHLSVMEEQRLGIVKTVPIENLTPEYRYHLVMRRDHVFSPLLRSFLNAFSRICEERGIPLHPDAQYLERRGVLRRPVETT